MQKIIIPIFIIVINLLSCKITDVSNKEIDDVSTELTVGSDQVESYQNGSEKIRKYMEHLMKRHGIPGVSLAIIKDGKVLHRPILGFANLEHQVPIKDESIFRIYSLTKPMVSVAIFQLIENGKLSLEDPISKFISDLPEDWNEIQLKHLLTHSSGLADMTPLYEFKDLTEQESVLKVRGQEIKFSAGEIYDYNQTGFWLLQKIIEKIISEDMSSFILKNQFPKTKNAFFSCDSRDIVLNRVTPYFPFATGSLIIENAYLQGKYADAMTGMNITMDEFIEWDKKLIDSDLLKKKTTNTMWEKFPYSKSTKTFAYGWDMHNINGHISYGFSGSMCTAYRIYPEKKLSIIYLSNGLSEWYHMDNMIDHIVSFLDDDITDLNNLAFESLLIASFELDKNGFIHKYKDIRTDDRLKENNFEHHLNDLGYYWLMNFERPEKAIEIFELNAKEYPDSWNTYDSLAEAYEKDQQKEKALINYQKAYHLNSDQGYRNKTQEKIDKLQL